MKVLVTDNVSDQGIDILREELEVDICTNLTEEQLCDKIKGYDALIVRSGTQVTEQVITSADVLKVIGRAGVGVDNIDTKAATRKGIFVVNAPEGNTIAAAEHTIAMMLSLSRNIPITNNLLKEGKWERKKYTGVEVKGKVVGVIGLGKIGYEVAKRLKGMDMRVISYDPFVNQQDSKKGIEIVDLETLLQESDYITAHVPLSDDTHYLLSEQEFNQMKEGVRVINCARGGVIDEQALYHALKDGKVAGAALDVFEQEPPVDNDLLTLENVVATPHLAASTTEAQINVAIDVSKTVLGILKRGRIKNAVNMEPVSMDEWNYINPFLVLSKKMGEFYSQYKNGRVDKIEVEYYGEITEHQTKLITSSAIKGLLKHILDVPVNIINSYQLANDRGIEVKEIFHRQVEDYSNLVNLKIYSGDEVDEVKGTVFSQKNARIVNVNDLEIDLIPQGHILLAPHTDQPGIIGRVSSILGKYNINIARMQVGRKSVGGEAVMMLTMDGEVPEEVIEEIKNIDSLYNVKIINFNGEEE